MPHNRGKKPSTECEISCALISNILYAETYKIQNPIIEPKESKQINYPTFKCQSHSNITIYHSLA